MAYLVPEKHAPKCDSAVEVNSPNVSYSNEHIESKYLYESNTVRTVVDPKTGKRTLHAQPHSQLCHLRTERHARRTGLMLVGIGGNNGTTLMGTVIANRLGFSWHTRTGVQHANYWGSITQSGTMSLGLEWEPELASGGAVCNNEGEFVERFAPFKSVLPLVDPNDLVIDGWDISSLNMYDAMRRAGVFEFELQEQLRPHMEKVRPRASIYLPDFIASNQRDRADNLIVGSRSEQLAHIRKDIREFREQHGLERVIVMWTANTERFAPLVQGVNDTAENLLRAIEENTDKVAPSTIFAIASVLEGCSFVNGSPQNTLVPGLVELAAQKSVYLLGDDLKTGQTKVKSALVDFLIGAGIKLESCVSYNHLGNNDGKNLAEAPQFRSKEVSKSSVIDDLVHSNPLLYAEHEKPDHTIVIKYVPAVGDSKRAMDEYSSAIAMGGHNTLVLHNTCEDSLLAVTVMLDLVVLLELLERVTICFNPVTVAAGTSEKVDTGNKFERFNALLAPFLSFLLKAPAVPEHTPCINSLYRQRACIENLFRALVGLPPSNHLYLEMKLAQPYMLTKPQRTLTESATPPVQTNKLVAHAKSKVKAKAKATNSDSVESSEPESSDFVDTEEGLASMSVSSGGPSEIFKKDASKKNEAPGKTMSTKEKLAAKMDDEKFRALLSFAES